MLCEAFFSTSADASVCFPSDKMLLALVSGGFHQKRPESQTCLKASGNVCVCVFTPIYVTDARIKGNIPRTKIVANG